MGKEKKGFNWKAREVVKTSIDDSTTTKIKLDASFAKTGHYDECNELVLPAQKRKTKKKKEHVTIKRLLSKSQRKRLETIVSRKAKKENRATLLEQLSQVQASPEVISRLTSLAAVQTKGLKKHFLELEHGEKQRPPAQVEEDVDRCPAQMNTIAGSRKRKHLLACGYGHQEEAQSVRDPNVVGLTDSSEDSEASEAEEENEGSKPKDEVDKSLDLKEEIKDEEAEVEEVKEDQVDNEHAETTENQENQEVVKPVEKVKVEEASKPAVKCKPAVFVPVARQHEVQEARLKLPILAEEQQIMEAITEHPVVILAGETGSGKTTQLPQFLYEAGYATNGRRIGITEPRRVAAVSMSQRVAYEMDLGPSEVSYLIRFEGNVTPDTKIKFMTDGVLLKEIQRDFVLSPYSAVVLDEAHERSVYTDILVGLLSRIVQIRQRRGDPLKLVIMSATLRTEDFTSNPRLFKVSPPVIVVESRQFPVTIHYSKRTDPDYVRAACRKVCRIHTQLPDGGILVFLTGQQEVNTLVKKLRRAFPSNPGHHAPTGGMTKKRRRRRSESRSEAVGDLSTVTTISLDDYSALPPPDDTEGDMVAESQSSSDEDEDDVVGMPGERQPMWVLPLYSLLPGSKQQLVFKPPPEGHRLCVVATNVAETSLTIPGVKYVVDSGRVKAKLYDKTTGVSTFVVMWTSKASAEQRSGRAGRQGPGHAYRLYSSAVFNDQFEKFAPPEIQNKPIDDLVLQMKAMNIVKVVNFPFPSPPDQEQLRAAEKRLMLLGALEPHEDPWCSRVTTLGQTMAAFPVSPRFAKMLALSHQKGLLPYTVALVAALSVQEVLLEVAVGGEDLNRARSAWKEWARTRRSWAGRGNCLLLGDCMVLLRAVGAAEYASASGHDLQEFCEKNGLRHKAVLEVRKLRVQLSNEINLSVPGVDLGVDPGMKPPSDTQARLLRQVLLAGLADHVAHKVSQEEVKQAEDKARWRYAYRCGELEEPVFLRSSCILRKHPPDWVVYQEVYENQRLYMRGVTAIEPEWLPMLAPSLCNLSEPLPHPGPRYDTGTERLLCHVSGTFGKAGWLLPEVEVEFPPGKDRYKWFACFLLEGVVFPRLARFRASLLSPPNVVTKSWASLNARTGALLSGLTAKGADSKKKLEECWKQDPKYLLSAYQSWLPQSAHVQVSEVWPPT